MVFATKGASGILCRVCSMFLVSQYNLLLFWEISRRAFTPPGRSLPWLPRFRLIVQTIELSCLHCQSMYPVHRLLPTLRCPVLYYPCGLFERIALLGQSFFEKFPGP